MFKKLNIILLALLLTLTGAILAGAATNGNGSSPAVKNLSLDEALQLAQENNSSIKNAQTELKKAEVKVDQSEHVYEEIKDAQDSPFGYMFSVYDAGVGSAYVNKEAAAKGKEVSEKAYEVTLEQIKLMIKSKYYGVLEAQDTVKVKEAALQRAQKQLDMANASFKVGSVAKTDVLQAEAALAQAKAELTKVKNNYQLAVIDLNKEIGLDANTELKLTTTVNQQDVLGNVDMQQYINEALEKRIDIARDKMTVEVAQITYDKLKIYKGPRSYQSKLAQLDLDTANTNLEQTKKDVVYDVTQAYLNVQAAGETLASLEKAVEQAAENLRLTELRYQVGVGTSLEVLNSSVYLSEMETNRVKALYGYNLAKMTFETAKLAPPPAAY